MNRTLGYHRTVELTDAVPTFSIDVETADIKDVIVFVKSNKGMTVTVTPLPFAGDLSVVGPVSNTLTIADGGETKAGQYTNIGVPNTRILATKTEAGSTTGFTLDIRGTII